MQKHYLAGNFAAKLKDELIASDNEILFGETLSYKKIYVGTIDSEYVTVKEFIDGTFCKYINKSCCWIYKAVEVAFSTQKLPASS